MSVSLRVTLADGQTYLSQHATNVVVIGREPKCDLRLAREAATTVSAAHVRLRVGPQGVTLEDLGSTNGTYLGERRVGTNALLKAGDRFSLGRSGPTVEVVAFCWEEPGSGEARPRALGYLDGSEPGPQALPGREQPALAPVSPPTNRPEPLAAAPALPPILPQASHPPGPRSQHSTTRAMLIALQRKNRHTWLLVFSPLLIIAMVALWTGFRTDADRFTRLAATVQPAVITVKTDRGLGSGFHVGRGRFVTNLHVVAGASRVTVVFSDNEEFSVQGFLAASAAYDLAILHVDLGHRRPPVLELRDSPPTAGADVAAFGSPLGFTQSFSAGHVSHSDRRGDFVAEALRGKYGKDIYHEDLHFSDQAVWIQTTAPINPGNSGRPLVDRDGLVVGVNTWGIPDAQDMNFAGVSRQVTELLKAASLPPRPWSELPRK